MDITLRDSQDGAEVLRGRLRDLPSGPGVYRMLGDDARVLYVGKARNLKARVTQYTQFERMGARIRKMVFETRDLVIVETRTEAEALLLEANLIKNLRPKYNITMRDDSSYVSVVITGDEVPLIRAHRGARARGNGPDKAEYFGPYPSAGAVYATLDLMERAFRLRTCSDGTFRHRTRPCLKYDIKRCSGPCVGKISPVDYARTVAEAKRFLHGERQAVLGDLQAQMSRFAETMDYEAAAAVRDRIKALAHVVPASGALTHALDEADVFGLVVEGGRVAVQAFYYRNGQHVGNHVFYPTYEFEHDGGEAELMRIFLALHYVQRTVPPQILVNIVPVDAEALMDALGVVVGRKIRLEQPQRGEKAEIVQQVVANAQAALRRKVAETGNWSSQMALWAQMLGRAQVARVECYDISNISGRYPVASCVVAGPDGMDKARYRKYAIQTKDTPDDYAMLREVLQRRVVRAKKDHDWPDVLLVDGGKGQLNVLVDVMRQAGVLFADGTPALVGIAKGEERDKGLETLFHAVPDAEGDGWVQLPVQHDSPLIFVLQRIRDEAHRFAITYHRSKRAKALEASRLDDIPGVGAAKKKALLLHFGSVAGVRGADEAALAAVPGIGPVLGEIIYRFFQES
jgi:excinuclease ABC subunit C